MLIIPEIILYDLTKSLLDLLKRDLETNVEEKNTIIYQLFTTLNIGEISLFQEAKKLVLRAQDNPRKLSIRYAFDRSRAEIPTIHIVVPNEQWGGVNSLGAGREPGNYSFDDNLGQYNQGLGVSSQSTYSLIITSNNDVEVIIIYNIIKHLLQSEQLEFKGLHNPTFGGSDLRPDEMIVPMEIFVKTLNISFFYNSQVPSLFSENLVKILNFEGNPSRI